MVWPALLVALLLFGCTLGPDFVKPKAAVSPNWLDANDPRVKTGPARVSGLVEGVQRPGPGSADRPGVPR